MPNEHGGLIVGDELDGALQLLSTYDVIWRDDMLNRRVDAENIRGFVLDRHSRQLMQDKNVSCVLNLDAGWGTGKTFLLERLSEQLRAQGNMVAFINAWEEDYSDDPFVPVLAAISDAIQPALDAAKGSKKPIQQAKLAWQGVKTNGRRVALGLGTGVASQLLKRLSGYGLSDLQKLVAQEDTKGEFNFAGEAIESVGASADVEITKLTNELADNLLREHAATKQSIKGFKENLATTIRTTRGAGLKTPLFVFIDELDRCRPTYAISMLERIKHLFDVEGVAFVVATDTEQLRASIKAVYGSEFDPAEYLRRFFDRTYKLAPPDPMEIIAQWAEEHDELLERAHLQPKVVINSLSAAISPEFRFSLRSLQQCLDILVDILSGWDHAVPPHVEIMWPMILGHHKGLEPSLTRQFAKEFISEFGYLGVLRVGDTSRTMSMLNMFDALAKLFETNPWPGPEVLGETFQRGTVTWLAYVWLTEEGKVRPAKKRSLITLYADMVQRAGLFFTAGGEEHFRHPPFQVSDQTD